MYRRKTTFIVSITLALLIAVFALTACATATSSPETVAPTTTSTPESTVPAAPDPAAAVMGIYKTILPGASSPGIDGTLYLNYDGSLRQVLDYLNEAEPFVEVGTWTATEDGTVTLTATGQEGKAYDTPEVTTLHHTGNTLVTDPDPDAPGAILTVWYEFGAMAMGEVEMPYDADMAAQRMENNLAETYKAFLPSASCCGRDVSLSLQIDGIAVMKTDYLNGEDAVEEVGTWESTGTGSLSVNLNSQQDRVYDTPVVTGYVVENGTLVADDGTVLRSVYGYAMYVIAQASGETASVVDMDNNTLTEATLTEAQYDLPDLGEVQLRAGRYEHKYGSGATEVDQIVFQAAGFGDLNGDGVEDGAAVVAVSTGGSGSFYYLAAMLNQAGEPQQAGVVLLGDRIQLESVTVEDGAIVVKMKVAADGDPLCCPSHEVTQTYRLVESGLELVEES